MVRDHGHRDTVPMLSIDSVPYFERQRRCAAGCLGVGHGGEIASEFDGE